MFNKKLVPGLIFAASGLISCASTSSPTSLQKTNSQQKAKLEQAQSDAVESEKSLQDKEKELAEVQDQLTESKERNTHLRAQVWIDQEYDKAIQLFPKNEIEIIKKDDKLILRLKRISFATNKFNVDKKDRAFVDRLQKTIQGMNSHQITLVGYADSIGSKKLNSDLSLKRAEAVQAVLQPNNFLASGKIQTEGMGEEKPIATNLTRQGRSQNRRVDLVLTAASHQ